MSIILGVRDKIKSWGLGDFEPSSQENNINFGGHDAFWNVLSRAKWPLLACGRYA